MPRFHLNATVSHHHPVASGVSNKRAVDLPAPRVPKAWACALISVMWAGVAVVCLGGGLTEPALGACAVLATGIFLWFAIQLVRHPVNPATRAERERKIAKSRAYRTAVICAVGAAVTAAFVGWGVLGELRVRREGIPVSFKVIDTKSYSTAHGNSSSRVCLAPVDGSASGSDVHCVNLSGTTDVSPGEIVQAHVDRNDGSYIVLDGMLPNDTGFLAFAIAFGVTMAAAAAVVRRRPSAVEIDPAPAP